MIQNNFTGMTKIFLFVLVLFISAAGNLFSGIPSKTPAGQSQDSIKKADTASTNVNPGNNSLQIDTTLRNNPVQTVIPTDTIKRIDTTLIVQEDENIMTNTKLFIYILLTVLGLGLFFFIFVINLFKTFHKKKSTRQSLLLSWSLFFVISIIWVFIVWGLLAGFWTTASFMIIVIFLFIISLIMTIIAIKSK